MPVILKRQLINTLAKACHTQIDTDFTDAYPKVFHHKFDPHFCTGNVVLKESKIQILSEVRPAI